MEPAFRGGHNLLFTLSIMGSGSTPTQFGNGLWIVKVRRSRERRERSHFIESRRALKHSSDHGIEVQRESDRNSGNRFSSESGRIAKIRWPHSRRSSEPRPRPEHHAQLFFRRQIGGGAR